MYGGVSLAIYINGIAQELLRLVRASAPRYAPHKNGFRDESGEALLNESQLQGTERVYRRIAQCLGFDGQWTAAELAAADSTTTVRTRFVVDILSGTSAGGINAVFLAKALASGDDISALAKMWVEEGAIEQLVNDRYSKFDGAGDFDRPASLLNSRRMYRKLVDALDRMDDEREKPTGDVRRVPRQEALVRDVDLFVTTTDIAGLPIALRLADEVVAERRHRNVFHFRYADGRNGSATDHFDRAANPMLAFAARCTSAFPFAFEPMTLADMDDVLRRRGTRDFKETQPNGEPWRKFFPAYTGESDDAGGDPGPVAADDNRSAEPWLAREQRPLAQRAFGDGGYLDNKPFEYAISSLATRSAGVPVDRKLIYLEPAPEHPEFEANGGERPNAIENVVAALSLARYETIRGDLQRVLVRNRLVDRVSRVVRGIDDDIAVAGDPAAAEKSTLDAFMNGDLADLIRVAGPAYGGYHRLKVSALTDEIADYVARVARFDEHSDEFQAIRHLVGAWRSHWYAPRFADRKGSAPQGAMRPATPFDENAPQRRPGTVVETENLFLLRYDLSYRVRRLDFVLSRIDQCLCVDDASAAMLGRFGLALEGTAARDAFTARLKALRDIFENQLVRLRKMRLALLSRDGDANPLAKAVGQLGISREAMHKVLMPPTTDTRQNEAWTLIDTDEQRPKFQDFEKQLRKAIYDATRPIADQVKAELPAIGGKPAATDGVAVANALVRSYHVGYDRFDQLIFPTYYSTDVGQEADVVDVLRVSPEDAQALIDERALTEQRRKLAGRALGNFGAFLDRRWRWNDMMWGRLDAAERLITTLLPGNDDTCKQAREQLIAEAHGIILEEELRKRDAEQHEWATAAEREDIQRLIHLSAGNPEDEAARPVLSEKVRKAFRDHYRLPDASNPQQRLSVATRATTVVGRMLTHMSDEYALVAKPGAWLTRLGSIAWALVEVAIPRSTANLLGTYWFKLLYAFEAALVVLGVMLLETEVRNFGLRALGFTALVHLTVLMLNDVMRSRTSWPKRVAVSAAIALALTMGLGMVVLFAPTLRSATWGVLRGPGGFTTAMKGLLEAVVVCAVAFGATYLEYRRLAGLRIARETALVREELAKVLSERVERTASDGGA
jgi:patatin-related protein